MPAFPLASVPSWQFESGIGDGNSRRTGELLPGVNVQHVEGSGTSSCGVFPMKVDEG